MELSALVADNPHFTIFGYPIYYYAVIIVCGIILATVVVALLFKRRNIPTEWVLDLLLCILPLGIVGARTFFVLTDPSSDITQWFSTFRDGGLSIIGGVIGGAIGVVLFCLIHKINFFRVADCLVPGVILAQAIGRWGNFVNQEVYGAEVTNEALQWFPFAVFIEKTGEWHYAFFFYESMLNLVIFALLFVLMWKFKKKPSGLALAGYLFGYGTVRSIMEPLRDPQFILGSSMPVSQVIALVMAFGGLTLAICLLIWNYKKYGRLFGAADEAEGSAVLPVYYTAEQRRKAEEERRRREAARAAVKKQGPPDPLRSAVLPADAASEKGKEGENAASQKEVPADLEKTEEGENNSSAPSERTKEAGASAASENAEGAGASAPSENAEEAEVSAPSEKIEDAPSQTEAGGTDGEAAPQAEDREAAPQAEDGKAAPQAGKGEEQ